MLFCTLGGAILVQVLDATGGVPPKNGLSFGINVGACAFSEKLKHWGFALDPHGIPIIQVSSITNTYSYMFRAPRGIKVLT